MGINFRQFLEHNPSKIYGSFTSNPNGPGNTVGKHNDGNTNGDAGSFVSTAWSGSESNTEKPFVLPGVDLIKFPEINSINLPNVSPIKDESPIESVDGDIPRPGKQPKNPIKITLSSGRKILMSFDEFKRAGGVDRIKKGNRLQWVLSPKEGIYRVKSIT